MNQGMTINHRTAIARKVFKMSTDSPSAELVIALADSISEHGLDSMDLGDALGEFIAYAESEWESDEISKRAGGECLITGLGITVTITADWDLFEWGSELPPGPFDHLTREDIENGLRGIPPDLDPPD